jgi:Tetratricopeptide repeat
MDNSTHDMSEKLVQYLDGELAGAEKEELEQELTADKLLQDELENLKAARAAVKLYGLQQKVSGIHQQMMAQMQTPVRKMSPARRLIRYSMAMAASVVLIAGGFFAYNIYTLSPNKVFASNYHSYELSTMRDNSEPGTSVLENDYREKKYTEVTGIVYDRPFTVRETFLRAISFIELKDNAKAINEFKKVIAENEAAKTNLLKDEAEYYLALTYIRNKDYDPALDLLKKIKDKPGHLYHEKITAKLIRQVKMLRWR